MGEAHICNSGTQGSKTGADPQVPGQPGLHSEILFQKKKSEAKGQKDGSSVIESLLQRTQ